MSGPSARTRQHHDDRFNLHAGDDMSVHILSWVLKHSPATRGSRLVLIVLADHAGHDGTNAYPSVQTIAHQARLSERATRYALRDLENCGLISYTGLGPAGTRCYRVNTDVGKFDELPPLNNSSSFLVDRSFGSIDGSGASNDTNPSSDCPGATLAPPF